MQDEKRNDSDPFGPLAGRRHADQRFGMEGLRMTTQRLPAALAILAFAYSCSVPAEPFATEAEKADRIKALLEKYPLKLQRGSGLGNHSAKFCNGVFAAMKRADKAIEYVEPVVKTNDPKHPALARYNDGKLCPLGEKVERNMPYGGDIRLIGDRDYRLYRIDAARKFKNGPEEIIYVEQIFPRPESSLSYEKMTGYLQVDFARCEYYPLVAVTPPTFRAHGMKETLSAMIRYRGKHYVVKMDRSSNPGMYLPLYLNAYTHTRDGIADFPVACKWEYLTSTPSGE